MPLELRAAPDIGDNFDHTCEKPAGSLKAFGDSAAGAAGTLGVCGYQAQA